MGSLTFMLWGPFNPEFFHCTDYVMLLQLPRIFGTCLGCCSEFSCTSRVESHFINTHFYVCSFYIPYAKPVWPSCQHTSQIWVTRCFPLVYCHFWRASRGELFGSFTQAASYCACEYVLCSMNEEGDVLWNASPAECECRSGIRVRSYQWYSDSQRCPQTQVVPCVVLGERN